MKGGDYKAEIYEVREFESGATIKDTTAWNETKLDRPEARASAEFFQPAIERVKEEADRY